MRLWKLRARRAPAPAVMHQLGVQRLTLVVFILMMTWLLYRLILLLHDRRKAERESVGARASVPRWRRRSSLRADHAWIRRLSGETAGEALDIVDSRRSTSGDCTPASEATITGDDVSDDDKQRDREAPKSTRRTLVFTPPTPPLKRRQSAPELVAARQRPEALLQRRFQQGRALAHAHEHALPLAMAGQERLRGLDQ